MVYAAVAQAFRAPNLSDLTRLDVARSGELETPSPGVEPETYVSYEFGVKFAGTAWSGQAAYFNTEGEDVIIRAPTGQVVNGLTEVTKVNAGETSVDGIEAEVSYAVLDRLSLFASGMYLDGEGDAYPSGVAADPVREPIDLLMPPNWRLGARWIDATRGLRLEALVEHADKQDDLSTRDKLDTQRIPPGGTPAYTTVSLRSQWQFRPKLALSLALENLTDEDYRVHGSGVNEPGRNVIASFVVGM
jgi:hemoglobin/transferrin/lactoferrin receptor protein